ncbi:MAG: Gfo/Idh/MocA family oxidoreductase [Bacteroidales bacterium]|jgi:predicted dehydrogenase|nr:Gfo/Idh/MocA family oxidoreductase [Bacteroidales bacterium]MDD2205419.1 Gfo/Idh/MocA family oxidoreductase [Bacteroidales bacterium]MDD3151520.1 Gfo/Idh/MocA family oxidoreductase [Bacteroidales bacterium]MDD3914823.1 Gfo/Idh/MocA family oxidoreductase [Bacteroidales bacterium]MDD4634749.1 Gfo/Idh/MocA family oxidoreductase [Bacteroidales bacterium]
MKKICVVGGGRWGKNHINTLHNMGCLAAIVETNAARLSEFLHKYPDIQGYTNIEDAIKAHYDGYTVAIPAEKHYETGKKILEAGLNLLMEKPMTLKVAESEELCEIAKKNSVTLMVGHVLLFHPAIIKIKKLIDEGKIGELYYLYSTRLNFGTVRTEESVFSSFAPHDISVLNYLIGKKAVNMQAKGAKFLQSKVYDTTMTQLEYPDNVHAHIFVSWLHPFKEQRIVVIGSKGMISFDDATKDKELHFYNKHIDFENGQPVKIENPDEIIEYESKMPLEEELKYFVANLGKHLGKNSGEDGLEVVRILTEVENEINK